MAASTEPHFPPGWRVSDPVHVTTTFASTIWRVRRDDGSTAIIKALRDFPDVWDELRGAHFLDWRDGTGAVRLLGFEGRMMMLEDGGTRLLSDVIAAGGDDAATAIAGEALAQLHAVSERKVPAQLQPLQERFASLFAKARSDVFEGRVSRYAEVAPIAARLLDDPTEIRPLHGDLHHDNLVFGPRGWLAIDPKGVIGDPGFDAGNLFFNPLSEQEGLCLKPERIGLMADMFGRELGQSPGRILDHAIAYGCLSASWHAEDGNAEDEAKELGVVDAIRAVRANA